MKQNTDFNFNFLLVGAKTDIGQVRKANEDSMRTFEVANMKVFVVCDGMGGHVGGKMASETAVTAIHNFFLNNITLDPREAIYNSIVAANEAILNKARQQPKLTGMGSTCVVLVVTSDGKVYYGHVGDSRIYIVANHRITQLTEDHSVVYEMFKARIIKTREEMERHPRKNEITNALGLPNMQPPTICHAPIEADAGNCFLLCSDGLTGMVADEQIQRVISKHEIPIQQRANKLVEMANNNGGVDNITVELVEFTVGTQQIGDGSEGGKFFTPTWKRLLFYGLPALVILGGLAWYLSTKEKPVPDPANNEIPQEQIVAPEDTVKQQPPEQSEIIVPDSLFPKPEKEHPAGAETFEIVSDTIGLELQKRSNVNFSGFEETKKVKLKNGSTMVSSEKTIEVVGKVKNNSVSIKWTKGDAPPQKIVFIGEGDTGTKYVITLYLKKLEQKNSEKRQETSKDKQKEDSTTIKTP